MLDTIYLLTIIVKNRHQWWKCLTRVYCFDKTKLFYLLYLSKTCRWRSDASRLWVVHIQNKLPHIRPYVSYDQIRNVSTKHLLSTLHWLLVRRRIDFKIAVLTYKLLSTGQPSCLACKITPHVSGRRLRSSESGTLTVPRIQTAIG